MAARRRSVATPRWLTADERAAWLAFVRVLIEIPAALDAQLRRDTALNHFEYGVLARLSLEPEGTRQLADIARGAHSSLSRLSHLMRRLESRGLLKRYPLPTDGRVNVAELTESGRETLEAAAPLHVEQVRTLIFDRLTPEQVQQLTEICTALADPAPGVDRP